MQNKLRIILFGVAFLSALVFSSGMALPASAASATASQTSTVSKSVVVHTATLPQARGDYQQGFRDGFRDRDRFCRAERGRHHHQHRFHRRGERDFERGFVDGFNFAEDHDRFCRRR